MTTDTTTDTPTVPVDTTGPDPKRWLALAVIAVAQLMVVLDASIVTIALPSAQRSLHISTDNRQWVVTAYTLAFGGLLLLGGRIADYVGRKRMFIIGLHRLRRSIGPRRGGGQRPHAVRGPGPPGGVRRPAGPGRPLPDLGHLHRGEGAGHRLRGLRRHLRRGRRHRADHGRASSPSTPRGAGACWSTCRSPSSPPCSPCPWCARAEAQGNTSYDIPGAVRSAPPAWWPWSTASPRPPRAVGPRPPPSPAWWRRAVLLATFVVIEMRAKNPLLPMRVILDRTRGGSFLSSLMVGLGPDGDVPLPHLLLPGEPGVLGAEDRLRLPALLGRHHRGRRGGQQDPAPDRPPAPDGGRVRWPPRSA